MARREAGNMQGQRFLGNTNSLEVHDLDNEKKNCQIDKVIAAGHDRPYIYLHQAHRDGFDSCGNCMTGSLR